MEFHFGGSRRILWRAGEFLYTAALGVQKPIRLFPLQFAAHAQLPEEGHILLQVQGSVEKQARHIRGDAEPSQGEFRFILPAAFQFLQVLLDSLFSKICFDLGPGRLIRRVSNRNGDVKFHRLGLIPGKEHGLEVSLLQPDLILQLLFQLIGESAADRRLLLYAAGQFGGHGGFQGDLRLERHGWVCGSSAKCIFQGNLNGDSVSLEAHRRLMLLGIGLQRAAISGKGVALEECLGHRLLVIALQDQFPVRVNSVDIQRLIDILQAGLLVGIEGSLRAFRYVCDNHSQPIIGQDQHIAFLIGSRCRERLVRPGQESGRGYVGVDFLFVIAMGGVFKCALAGVGTGSINQNVQCIIIRIVREGTGCELRNI